MKKVKIGVLGGFRGKTMVEWCVKNEAAEVVAICDANENVRSRVEKYLSENHYRSTLYASFDEFLRHDMDAVVLANYANEHAPFAIRCLEHGLHVMSEVLPVQTLSEAVRLAEAVEKSGKKYVYAENYCYMPAPSEMKRLYERGELGEFEYGEGEYVHDCIDAWYSITYGDPAHWRNTMSAFYYCTHSVGPLLHITGLRPVRVTGFELPHNESAHRIGYKAGSGAVEMVTLENGGIIKSFHALTLKGNSVWYNMYGTKGRAESEREGAGEHGVAKLYMHKQTDDHPYGEWGKYRPTPDGKIIEGSFGVNGENKYTVQPQDDALSEHMKAGHNGSDFFTMKNFVNAIRGEDADIIDVYEALDMAFVGLFGYFSVLEGGKSMEIPDFRKKEVREKYRNDNRCTDPKVAGKQLLPSYSKGNPDIPPENYAKMRKLYEDSVK